MTEQDTEHPTSGRRRRYKSPPTLHDAAALPVPRLADHLDTENGPSDEEGEKEAKRRMNMIRLWESLKWILGKPKGLKRV